MPDPERIEELLEKLEKRYSSGEISEDTYKELRKKYVSRLGGDVAKYRVPEETRKYRIPKSPRKPRATEPSRAGKGRRGERAVKIGIALLVAGLVLLTLGVGYDKIGESLGISTPGAESNPIDAVIIMDQSGSMMGSKLDTAKESAKLFVNKLDGNDRVALVIFAFSSRIRLDFTHASDQNTIESSIDGISTSGDTALWEAVDQGVDLVNSEARSGVEVVAVLLTDGKNNTGDNTYEEVADYAVASSVPAVFYSVGLGAEENVDENKLQDLSTRTGGEYWRVDQASELPETFTGIAKEVTVEREADRTIPYLLIICGIGLIIGGLAIIFHRGRGEREK